MGIKRAESLKYCTEMCAFYNFICFLEKDIVSLQEICKIVSVCLTKSDTSRREVSNNRRNRTNKHICPTNKRQPIYNKERIHILLIIIITKTRECLWKKD